MHRPTHTIAGQRRRALLTVAAGAAALALPFGSAAQAYPARPIRVIVPFPPGGGFDAVIRPLAEKVSVLLRQNLVIDNKACAGGNIGMAEAARAPNDGYTLLFANETLATNPNVYKSVPFDPLKDFEPVAMVASTQMLLAINPNLPARNLAELTALSAREPITFGTPGVGTSPHLFGEMLNLKTPLKLRHIPYRGTGPAVTDAIGGQTHAVMSTASALAPHVAGGRLRGIAVMSDKRSAQLPDVPTLAEAGIRGYTHEVWYCMVAPANTPQPLVAQVRDAITQALRDPDLVARLQKAGIEPVPGDGAAVTRQIRGDLQRWATVVAEANVPRE